MRFPERLRREPRRSRRSREPEELDDVDMNGFVSNFIDYWIAASETGREPAGTATNFHGGPFRRGARIPFLFQPEPIETERPRQNVRRSPPHQCSSGELNPRTRKRGKCAGVGSVVPTRTGTRSYGVEQCPSFT